MNDATPTALETALRLSLLGLRIGATVTVDGNAAWSGELLGVSGGWATIRQGGRLDEVQVSRVSLVASLAKAA